MARVTDEQVAAYEPLVKRLAHRLSGLGNAEFDDLAQEGRIAVWQTLARKLRPSPEVIEGRMRDWARFCRRLKQNDAIAYDLLLPIEDYNDIDLR